MRIVHVLRLHVHRARIAPALRVLTGQAFVGRPFVVGIVPAAIRGVQVARLQLALRSVSLRLVQRHGPVPHREQACAGITLTGRKGRDSGTSVRNP